MSIDMNERERVDALLADLADTGSATESATESATGSATESATGSATEPVGTGVEAFCV